jgi:predicted ATPase
MINKLKLIHFKSHKETEIEFKNLTVLCGGNGVGKSSFIQALLLLRQTHLVKRLDNVLFLNGRLYEIGSIKDALHVSNEGDLYKKIVFDLDFNDGGNNAWIFNADSDFNFLNLINKDQQNFDYNTLALFNRNFQYISAFRGSEQVIAQDFEVVQENQISYSKGKGDMAAHYLHYFGRRIQVLEALRHPDQDYPFLEDQVSAWESDIINSGVNIVSEKITENQYAIKYNFVINNFELAEHKFSSDNVGYGLSYILPILIAILTSQPNDLVIIENPEAHLHPYSISRLTELIAIASQAGIQIIIETHSDHIINGLLVQTKKFEDFDGSEGIDKDNISIYQFELDPYLHKTNPI